ncbi:spore germination protein KC [Paenibacillus sp. DS2015]|uniref:Ger(x)C family spore germination protein n=1 Tax=Paenibacillus sp. DS2015 TaxID=3373917 RepID=UPI003D1CED10
MRKMWILTGMLLVCPIFVSGCWDRKEINDIAFVLGSAVDKEGTLFRTSVQIALPSQLGGAGGKGEAGGGKAWYMESKLGKTVHLANVETQRGNSRTLNYSHRRSLLIGEEMARSGISMIMDASLRTPQNRLLSMVAVTEGPAYKVLNSDAPMEQFPTEMVRELISNYTKKAITIKKLLTDLLTEGIDPVLPLFRIGESVPPHVGESKTNIQAVGLAIFKGDRMVGTLKGDMAKVMLIGMNEDRDLEMNIPAPRGKGLLLVAFRENVVKMVPQVKEDHVAMLIHIHMRGKVTENASNYSPYDDISMSELEQVAEAKVKQDLTQSLAIIQQYHADTLGFGQVIYHKKPKDWNRLKDRWEDIYPLVKVEVEAEIEIETEGQALEPMGIPSKEIIHD